MSVDAPSGVDALQCTEPGCERRGIRTRNGRRVCLVHPTTLAPAVEQLPPPSSTAPVSPPPTPAGPAPQVARPELAARTPAVSAVARPKVARSKPPTQRGAPLDAADVVRRHQSGESVAAIAKSLRVGQARASAVLREHDVTLSRARPRHFDVAEVVRRYTAGEGASTLAAELGVAQETRRRGLQNQGVKLRPRGSRQRVATVNGAEAARRYRAGEDLHGLAQALHIGHRRLREVLLEQGVTLRARGDVIGIRGVPPRPLDELQCVLLYTVEGLHTDEVARRLQVKGTRVNEVLRRAGVLKQALRTPSAPLDVPEVLRLYRNGLPIQGPTGIAARLQVRAARVAAALREAGVDVQRGQRPLHRDAGAA